MAAKNQQEIEDVNQVDGPSQIGEEWEDNWEVVKEEAPTVITFEVVGDRFTGTYVDTVTIEPKNGDEPFKRHLFRANGELYAINDSYDLAEALEDLSPGTATRITLMRLVPTKRGQNEMKSYRVETRS